MVFHNKKLPHIYFQKFPPRILSLYYCHPVKSAPNYYYYAYWLRKKRKKGAWEAVFFGNEKRSKKKKICQSLQEEPSFLLTNKINTASSCLEYPKSTMKNYWTKFGRSLFWNFQFICTLSITKYVWFKTYNLIDLEKVFELKIILKSIELFIHAIKDYHFDNWVHAEEWMIEIKTAH